MGVAAAAIVVASSTAYAYCPRGGGSYYKSSYGGHYKKYYKSKTYKNSYYKKDDDYEKPVEYEADDEEDDVAEGDIDGPGEPPFEDVSGIFEITEKDNCSERGCDGLSLRGPDGAEYEVGGLEYVDEMYEGASLEELNYHLAQNGGAMRGRLEEVREEEEITYKFICEKIYS
jgi:hypothetical protein